MSDQASFVPHSHIPYGKDGSGFYSDHHLSCYYANEIAIPLVVSAVQSSVINQNSAFTIVDYGAADGGTSMPLMYACVKAIREKYGNELPINIIYEDQAVNDFKSLFMRLQGLIPGPPSYLIDFPNVFVMASGTNFFQQCFPSNSVNLGFAASSFHWLSEKPCDLSDSVVDFFSGVPEEKAKYSKQAEEDWERILVNRAAELVPGGKMILAVIIKSHDKFYESYVSKMIYLLPKLWKDLADEGVITKEEFKGTNIITCWRSIEELKKPFECPDSPVNQAGLELVSLETKTIPCPLHAKYLKDKDAQKHAKRFTSSVRAWGNSTFHSGLSETRCEEEKARIVDELFRRYEAEVESHPDDYRDECSYCYLTIQKRENAIE